MADLFKYTGCLFDSKALGHSVAIVFIHFIEETQHVVSDVRPAHTERLANVVDEPRPLLFSQDFSIKTAYLLKFLRGMDKFISTCQALNSGETWAKVWISFGSNIHRIEIVS